MAAPTAATIDQMAGSMPALLSWSVSVHMARTPLADDRSARTGDRDRLAALHDPGGLGGAVVGRGPRRNAEARERDAGHQGDNNDLEMGRSVCTVNGMVHLKLPGRLFGVSLTRTFARRRFQDDCVGNPKWFRGAGELFRELFRQGRKTARRGDSDGTARR